MPPFAAVVKMILRPGRRSEAVSVFESYLPVVEDEPGTVVYVLAEDSADGDVLWVYEQYVDEQAAETHLGTAAYAQAMGALKELMAARPEVNLVTPVRGKGTPLP